MALKNYKQIIENMPERIKKEVRENTEWQEANADLIIEIVKLTKENAELMEENGRLRAENEQWRELDSRNRGYSFDDTEQ